MSNHAFFIINVFMVIIAIYEFLSYLAKINRMTETYKY